MYIYAKTKKNCIFLHKNLYIYAIYKNNDNN